MILNLFQTSYMFIHTRELSYNVMQPWTYHNLSGSGNVIVIQHHPSRLGFFEDSRHRWTNTKRFQENLQCNTIVGRETSELMTPHAIKCLPPACKIIRMDCTAIPTTSFSSNFLILYVGNFDFRVGIFKLKYFTI